MFSNRFMSNYIIVSISIIIKKKIIIFNIDSYQKNKKLNPMLLKQHTLKSIMCIIYLGYKIKLVAKSANDIMSFVIKTDRIMILKQIELCYKNG